MALITSGYAQLERLEPDPVTRSIALALLSELDAKRLSTGDTASWGYEFDVQTRWAFYPRGTPNTVATTFIAHAFLDWFELDRDSSLLAVASAAIRYLNEYLLDSDAADSFYAYVPGSRVLIHNANVLGCALATRVARLTGETGLAEAARQAANVTISAQRCDGLWPYGQGAGLEWIDAFHTAYVLDGLAELATDSPDSDLADSLRRGFEAYLARFFTACGQPKYTPSSLHPIDIHSASTAIDVLSRRAATDEKRIALAAKVCDWTLANMLDPRGYFHFQRHRLYTNRIPYVRWSQAHMFKALTTLLVCSSTKQ